MYLFDNTIAANGKNGGLFCSDIDLMLVLIGSWTFEQLYKTVWERWMVGNGLQHIQEAKERLIERWDTHLDSLAERLKEPRVRAVIEPMLAGRSVTMPYPKSKFH